MTITIQYSCNGCGIRDMPIKVPARETEDVVFWLEQKVGPKVTKDHRSRSPYCMASNCDIKIPQAPGSSRVGDPTGH